MIPGDAKRVFKGVRFDVYQWQQKMFDGSTATYEGLKRRSSVEILAIHKGKITVTHEEQAGVASFIGIPAGLIEDNEDPLVAAQRELQEETGLTSDDWELLERYTPMGNIEWTVHVYLARDCKKTAKQSMDPGEKIRVRYLTFEEFIRTVTKESFRHKDLALQLLKMHYNKTLSKFKKKMLK
jgi:ADP-ribose pyrophosphatase